MQAITVKLNGKEFKAKLGLDAIEQVEGQFDHLSIPQLLSQKQGISVYRAIIVAAISNEQPQTKTSEILQAVREHVEDGGLESLQEMVLDLVKGSGLFGKKAAEEKKD